VAEKLAPPDRAALRVAEWRARGDRIVIVSGWFDLLDRATVRAVRAAAGEGRRVIACVHGDPGAGDRHREPPLLDAGERALLAASLRAVDLALVRGIPVVDLHADERIELSESGMVERLRGSR
jgi:glycerol-3-phosphate cytidylyltransferase-like family protein